MVEDCKRGVVHSNNRPWCYLVVVVEMAVSLVVVMVVAVVVEKGASPWAVCNFVFSLAADNCSNIRPNHRRCMLP